MKREEGPFCEQQPLSKHPHQNVGMRNCTSSRKRPLNDITTKKFHLEKKKV